jgi:hypothetical protein
MALDLNNQAINFGNELPLLPFEDFGTYELSIVDYAQKVSQAERDLIKRELKLELGREPTDEELPALAYKGACDIATVKVLSSTNPLWEAGSVFGLYFDQHAVGDNEVKAAKRNRAFLAAAIGLNPRNAIDWNAARKTLLTTDLSGGGAKVKLSRRQQAGKGKYEGRTFTEDTYTPLA